MSEYMNLDMEKDQDNGKITYANDVVSTIVSVATAEVDGISGIAGISSLPNMLARGRTPRNVKVEINGQDVNVDVSVNVDYGTPIQKVGFNAQENVRKSVESMTGLHVNKVNLHVVGVSFEKENNELQQGQQFAMNAEGDVDEETTPAATVEILEHEETAPVEEEIEEFDDEEEEVETEEETKSDEEEE